QGPYAVRSAEDLARACDLRLMACMPRKAQLGLLLPEMIDYDPDETTVYAQAQRALQVLLEAAAWAGSGEGVRRLEEAVTDAALRRLALSRVERLIPEPAGGLDVVGLSSKYLKHGLATLRPEARPRVREALAA